MNFKKISAYFILAIIILTSTTSCNVAPKENDTKVNSKLVNTIWLLESINGDEIIYPADYKQNYIIFKGESEGFKLDGFAGCNNVSGTYGVGDHNTFAIGNIMSTKMMCPFAELENKYLRMFENAKSYKIEGYYLTIFDREKEIAIFKDAKELQTH